MDVFSSCILFVKKRISNLLACLLLPIKTEEWGACKTNKEKKKEKKKYDLNWIKKREHFELKKEN